MNSTVSSQEVSGVGIVTCPERVRVACRIWVVFGILLLVSALINLILYGSAILASIQTLDGLVALGIIVLGILFGVAFLQAGNHTLKGKSKGILGNGIASLFFGLINGAWGTYQISLLMSVRLTSYDKTLGYLFSSINLLSGIGLLIAGVLSILGAKAYKTWKMSG